ncbi:hypothetical protein [Glutamicibacter sp. NPDC087344]|uniref:hypothetical protein n=1 Tax=Glutamicibacter sp. NPDC087344 TaxID=3363994 RepID=UPI0037F34DFB
MKTRLIGTVLLLASVCLFVFSLDGSQRPTATACWVISTVMFIAAAMLLLGTIVGSSSATDAGSSRRRQR